jgi:hypothetical protein
MQSSLKPEEDHLDEDKPFKQMVKKQNFCVLSMLTPNSFPENKRDQYKDQKILGVKIRGVFETYEEAKTRSEQLQKNDKHHNIFVGEVGKWLPFNVDIATMETEDDPVYREQALNQYMKAYKDCLKEEEVEEKERKEQTLKATNAKVVTGQTDAPDYTGIGCPEITPPGIVPQSMKESKSVSNSTQSNESNSSLELELESESQLESQTQSQTQKVEELRHPKNINIDEQINTTQAEKSKIVVELEESKNNLKELESKLSAINQMYVDLKK